MINQPEKDKTNSLVFNSIPNPLIVTDINGCISALNPAAEALFKTDPAQSHEKLVSEAFFHVKGTDSQLIESTIRQVLVEKKAIKISPPITINQTDNHCFWAIEDVMPLIDKGKLVGTLVPLREHNLDQTMRTVSQLSGEIAHDFNNQLSIISGFLEFLESSTSEEKPKLWIDTISKATDRFRRIQRSHFLA